VEGQRERGRSQPLVHLRGPPKANKHEIREAVEKLFDVKVMAVHTMKVRAKHRRVRYQVGLTRQWKKAMVRLTPQSKAIEGF